MVEHWYPNPTMGYEVGDRLGPRPQRPVRRVCALVILGNNDGTSIK
jgi:hypothetical protein